MIAMGRAHKIWAWLTLLLFFSGMVSPRLVAAAMPSDCPMLQVERESLCRPIAKPEPTKPACCATRELQMARSGSISADCCCDMTAAPGQRDVPAVLMFSSDPVVLPGVVHSAPLPRVTAAHVIVRHRADETDPRGPPLRSSSPRAPPLS